MDRKIYTESEVIELTRKTVADFYSRQVDDLFRYFMEDFVFIGACDFQWATNLQEFRQITSSELQEAAVTISDEEYHILYHDQNVWILYGRYTARAPLGNGKIWRARVRATYVWQQTAAGLKLHHVHGSHAQDFPVMPAVLKPGSSFFEYISSYDFTEYINNTISFRDSNGTRLTIPDSQIIYFKAANQYCYLNTATRSYLITGGISKLGIVFANFIRLHRSYLVNPAFIKSIRRYTASVTTGEKIPIGQGRYTVVKKRWQDYLTAIKNKLMQTANSSGKS